MIRRASHRRIENRQSRHRRGVQAQRRAELGMGDAAS
jgi:hypothetical protein